MRMNLTRGGAAAVGAAALVALFAFALAVCAEDWPKWLGPRGDNISKEEVASTWPSVGPKQVWAVENAGTGHSSPVARDGKVYLFTLNGSEEVLTCFDAKTGKELYKFKTPSGIIGNVMTYTHKGKQYVAILSGVGGWAGIGLAAGLTDPSAGLGAVGGYSALSNYTALGGQLTVFSLPN